MRKSAERFSGISEKLLRRAAQFVMIKQMSAAAALSGANRKDDSIMAQLQCCFFSSSLMRTVDVTVLLPTDKLVPGQTAPQTPKRYKTLYLLHGIFGSCRDWVNGTRIAAWAQNRELAVVMPSGENKFYVDTPCPGEQFGRFIGEELVDWTRRSFPLSAAREDTFIGGLSMGGYGAIRAGLTYCGTFGAVVGLSSALIMENAVRSTYDNSSLLGNRRYFESVFGDLDALPGSDNDPYALVKKRLTEGKTLPKLYLACGTEDTSILPCNEAFHTFLTENHVEHTYITAPGKHDWIFWDTHIEKALDWLPLGEPVQGVSSGHVMTEA